MLMDGPAPPRTSGYRRLNTYAMWKRLFVCFSQIYTFNLIWCWATFCSMSPKHLSSLTITKRNRSKCFVLCAQRPLWSLNTKVILYCVELSRIYMDPNQATSGELRRTCAPVSGPVFPMSSPRLPPTAHIFVVARDEYTSFRAWWLVDKLNQVCLSRVTIQMSTVGDT